MGGKSRKTGGISKSLIDKIKKGGNLPNKTKSTNVNKNNKDKLSTDKNKGFDFDK